MVPAPKISESEITPPAVFFNRRQFLRGAILATSVAATTAVYRTLNGTASGALETPDLAGLIKPAAGSAGTVEAAFRVDEPMTSERDITHYNNFYEFTTQKDRVAAVAAGFNTKGWQLTVEGLVRRPRVFGLDELRSISPPEGRVYRMRCVEAWS